jgi:hypothetical protein
MGRSWDGVTEPAFQHYALVAPKDYRACRKDRVKKRPVFVNIS